MRDGVSLGPDQLHKHSEDGGGIVSYSVNAINYPKSKLLGNNWLKKFLFNKFRQACPFDNFRMIFYCKI